jgi:hypothetical protein
MLREFSFIFLLLLNGFVLAQQCQLVDDNLSNTQYGLSPHAIEHAREMLNRTVGDWKNLCSLEQISLVKRLNALVYNSCKSPGADPAPTDINALFDNCITACGGRSYVLRGLLAVYGLNSKYQNIYNIPIQGNHTAIEVSLKGREAFLDPTFGTYFSLGSIKGYPLSLSMIKYLFNKNELDKHVYQAKSINDHKQIASANLEEIYSQEFKSNSLKLSSYIEHEASGNPDINNILYLSANVAMKDNFFKIGCLDAKDPTEASSCFLKQTNELYSNTNPADFISYNFNVLGYSANNMKVNLLNFTSLVPNSYYKIILLINSQRTETVALNLSVFKQGIDLAPESNQVIIKPGLNRYIINFKANNSEGAISLYPEPGSKWITNLFAFQVQPLNYKTMKMLDNKK